MIKKFDDLTVLKALWKLKPKNNDSRSLVVGDALRNVFGDCGSIFMIIQKKYEAENMFTQVLNTLKIDTDKNTKEEGPGGLVVDWVWVRRLIDELTEERKDKRLDKSFVIFVAILVVLLEKLVDNWTLVSATITNFILSLISDF